MTNVNENVVLTLPLEAIHVDERQNVRQVYDEARMKELKHGIKTEGLLQPPTVRPPKEGEKIPAGKSHILFAGYRRFRALTELEYKQAPFVVKITDAKGGAIGNIMENVNREALSPYELACGCRNLRDQFGMTGEEISKVLKGDGLDGKGKSKQNVNNLMRLLDGLDGRIIDAWKERHEKASTYNLLNILGESPDDRDAQYQGWEILIGAVDPEKEEGEGGEGGEGGTEAKPKKAKVRKMADVTLAMAIVKKAVKKEAMEAETARVVLGVLEWCAGRRATLQGLKIEKDADNDD